MKFLVVGGTSFLGRRIVDRLAALDDASVGYIPKLETKFETPDTVAIVDSDVSRLNDARDVVAEFRPDVILNLEAYSEEETLTFFESVGGLAGHYLFLSNCNVYRAHGRLHGTEEGELEPVPLTEESPLREKPLKGDEHEEKRVVEKVVVDSGYPATLLRLPPMYGPDDWKRRFYPLMHRMVVERPHILLGETQANWRWTHAFVDNVANAVVMAAESGDVDTRIYNLGEQQTPTIEERVRQIAMVFEWNGQVVVAPDHAIPQYMRVRDNLSQDLVYDSRKIRTELNYVDLIDYYDGLRESVEWYVEHPPLELKGQEFSYSEEDAVANQYGKAKEGA